MRTLSIIIFCIALIGLALYVATNWSHAAQGGETLLKDQASYAEVSTTSTQDMMIIASSSRKINLPILVYHIVRPSYPSDSAAVRALALTPEVFDAEMDYLETAGYHIVQFSDLEHYFDDGKPLPANPIILSFDDGWGDQFTYAFPILQKYHYTATFFVFTNSIGRPGFLFVGRSSNTRLNRNDYWQS